jgi:L-lactate dehydrogenase complex protein LldG
MMERDTILHRVRTALGRTSSEAPAPPPPVYLRVPNWGIADRIRRFTDALEGLGGRVYRAGEAAAVANIISGITGGRSAVVSSDALVLECRIPALGGVEGPYQDRDLIRAAASRAAYGITGAGYALAETGTLVMFAGAAESRLISLLPPAHIAIVRTANLLANLDELLTKAPDPAAETSAMILITGPSRTADIEQILVRGVHGPGEVHVILVDSETE